MVHYAIHKGIYSVDRDGFTFLQEVKKLVQNPVITTNVQVTVTERREVGAPKASRISADEKKTGPSKKKDVLQVDTSPGVSTDNVIGIKCTRERVLF